MGAGAWQPADGSARPKPCRRRLTRGTGAESNSRMIARFLALDEPGQSPPAAWLIDLESAAAIEAASGIAPEAGDLARAASRPPGEAAAVLRRRALVRRLAASALGVEASTLSIGIDARGAPFLAPPHQHLRISWAQRHGLLVIAVARRPVGVDVEIDDGNPEIPWNVLHEAERAALRAIAGTSARTALFLRIWAVKEAYLKALGTGFRHETAAFAVSGADGAHPRIADPAHPRLGADVLVEAVTRHGRAGAAACVELGG
jgi:hypothetical protein